MADSEVKTEGKRSCEGEALDTPQPKRQALADVKIDADATANQEHTVSLVPGALAPSRMNQFAGGPTDQRCGEHHQRWNTD